MWPGCRRRTAVAATGSSCRPCATGPRHGWRRADQPWVPPHTLDPWDEGLALEEAIDGDLDLIDWGQLSHVAERRMTRAVLRGDAGEVMRWHRVTEILDTREAELRRWAEEEEVRRYRLRPPAREAAETDSTDDPDSVSESGLEM